MSGATYIKLFLMSDQEGGLYLGLFKEKEETSSFNMETKTYPKTNKKFKRRGLGFFFFFFFSEHHITCIIIIIIGIY